MVRRDATDVLLPSGGSALAAPGRAPLAARANALLPGLYAWLSTVAFPAAAPRASQAARVSAGLALVALVLGSVLAVRRPSLARPVGLVAFVTLSAITWLLLGDLIAPHRVEPVRAALGGVAWAVFAFGWGAVRRTDVAPEDDPRAIVDEVLEPRRQLPAGATAVVGLSLVLGSAPIFLAWRIPRSDHALLGHAAALAAAIAMVSAGAVIAVERGQWRPMGSPRRRLARASGSLAALAILVMVGVLLRWVG